MSSIHKHLFASFLLSFFFIQLAIGQDTSTVLMSGEKVDVSLCQNYLNEIYKSGFDTSHPIMWHCAFINQSEMELSAARKELKEMGYQINPIKKNEKVYELIVQKQDKFNAASFFIRIKKLYAVKKKYGINDFNPFMSLK